MKNKEPQDSKPEQQLAKKTFCLDYMSAKALF